jgi:hypothetical protein
MIIIRQREMPRSAGHGRDLSHLAVGVERDQAGITINETLCVYLLVDAPKCGFGDAVASEHVAGIECFAGHRVQAREII